MLDLFDAFDRKSDEGGKMGPIWARAGELVSRLAGLRALSLAVWTEDDPFQPRITADQVQWAKALVEACIARISPDVEENAAASDSDAIRSRIMQTVERFLAENKECIMAEDPDDPETKHKAVRKSAVRRHIKDGKKYKSSEISAEMTGMVEDENLIEVRVENPTGRDWMYIYPNPEG